MKRYKVGKALFLIFPIFVLAIILSYALILFKRSYTWINLTNIALDMIILTYYFLKFCYEFTIDSQGINFYTVFKNYRVEKSAISHVRHSPFLTRVSSGSGNFYILTTPTGGRALKEFFKDHIG
jgi:hypothetical protein